MFFKVADVLYDCDFILQLLPIRQISRQGVEESGPVRDTSKRYGQQSQSTWPMWERPLPRQGLSPAVGSSRRSFAAPGRSGNRVRNSHGRPRSRQMRWKRTMQPAAMPTTNSRRFAGWSCSASTAVGEIESWNIPTGLAEPVQFHELFCPISHNLRTIRVS